MHEPSSDQFVRDLAVRADRRRRGRALVRRLSRYAPAAAGVLALVALAARLIGAPQTVLFGLLAAGLVALAIAILIGRRARPVSDVEASRLDADAALGGELRSACWFAAAPARDEWATYHLDQAADRLRSVAWDEVYPPVRARRAWAGTAVLVAAAVGLTMIAPSRGAAVTSALPGIGGSRAEFALLPEELRKKLEAMLDKLEKGQMSADEAQAKAGDLRDLLSRLDPALSEKLAKLAKQLAEQRDKGKAASQDKAASADPKDPNASAGLPEDVRWALEDLASRLANADSERRQTNPDNAAASQQTGEKGRGSEQAKSTQASASEAGMQLVREAASDAGDAKMMLGGGGAMGGDSRAGAGGNTGSPTGTADPAMIALALRRELVEAHADTLGANIAAEDIRRKTEQGRSGLGFTRATASATADRSRATAPPQVPDARLSLVRSYFIRR